MALTPDFLQGAVEVISAAPGLREAAAILRARDPALRVVLVDAMDMRDETPTHQLGQRCLYLATSNGHCWSITQQLSEATALILSQD